MFDAKLLLIAIFGGVTQSNMDLPEVDSYRLIETRYVLSNGTTSLSCGWKCDGCSGAMKWFNNDKEIRYDSSYIYLESKLEIRNYRRIVMDGTYYCLYESNKIDDEKKSILKSFNINLKTIDWPLFALESLKATLHDVVFLQCIKDDYPILNEDTFRIRWFHKDIEIINGFGSMKNLLLIKNVTSRTEGSYHCKIMYNGLTKSSHKVSLKINKEIVVERDFPSIQYISRNLNVVSSFNLSLLCIADTSNVNVRFTKKMNNSKQRLNIGLSTKGYKLVSKQAHVSDSGEYHCHAQNVFGSHMEAVTVTVFPKLEFTERNVETNIFTYSGSNISMNCDAVDTVIYFSWYFNGKKLENETDKQLDLSKVEYSDGGIYQCIVENKHQGIMRVWNVLFKDLGMKPIVSSTFLPPSNVSFSWEKLSYVSYMKEHNISNIYYQIHVQTYPELIPSYTENTKNLYYMMSGINSGIHLHFKVCTRSMVDENLNACTKSVRFVKEKPLTDAPVLKNVQFVNNKIRVSWLPYHCKLGEVKDFIIYLRIIYEERKVLENPTNVQRTFISFPQPSLSQADIVVKFGVYDVWMDAQNSVSESPLSKMFIVNAQPDDDPSISVDAKWEVGVNDSKAMLISWKDKGDDDTIGYVIYVTSIPYHTFWPATETYQLSKDRNKLKIHGKNPNKSYRISFAILIEEESSKYGLIKYLSGTMKFVTLTEYSNSLLPPVQIFCLWVDNTGVDTAGLYIGYENTPDSAVIHFTLLNEEKNDKREGHGGDPSPNPILLNWRDEITEYQWYHTAISVVSKKNTNVLLNSLRYTSCPAMVQRPTIVRDLRYEAITDRLTDEMYLVLSWKEPVYTGQCLFWYHINYTGFIAKLKLKYRPYIQMLVINDEQELLRENGLIKSKPLRLEANLFYSVRVSAVNCEGEGRIAVVTTHIASPYREANITIPSSELHQSKSRKTSWKSGSIGLISGITASVFLLFVVVALIFFGRRYGVCSRYLYVDRTLRHRQQQSDHVKMETRPFIYLNNIGKIPNHHDASVDHIPHAIVKKGNSQLERSDSLEKLVSCLPPKNQVNISSDEKLSCHSDDVSASSSTNSIQEKVAVEVC